MKKLIKKIFTKEHLKKLLKLLLVWGGIMLLLLSIVVAVFSCQGSKEPNKKQAINLTYQNNDTPMSSIIVPSSLLTDYGFWNLFYTEYVNQNEITPTNEGWNITLDIYYTGGYAPLYNVQTLYMNCYSGIIDMTLSLSPSATYYLYAYLVSNNSIELDAQYFDEDGDSHNMTIDSINNVYFYYDNQTFPLSVYNYIYNYNTGGDISSEEPVTSEPVTSEPVTSQAVTSEPVTSEPVSSEVVNQNRYVTISSYLDFNLIYGGTMLTRYVPNLYYKSNLSQVYQSSYDLEGITFYLQGEQSIKYNKIRVIFGRLSDYNFDDLQQTLDYLAFVDGEETIDSVNSSFLTYKGATNYLNLLDIDMSKLDCYYFVKEVYYIRTSPLEYLKVFDGIYTSTYTYYVNSNPVGTGVLSPTSNHVTGMSFARNGWLSGMYRRLVVTYDSGQLLDVPNQSLNDYTLLEYLMNNTGVNNEVIDYGFNSVFSLISGAFLSIAPILSLMILPNITIGMLLLVPLMIGIMLAIIKLIKK